MENYCLFFSNLLGVFLPSSRNSQRLFQQDLNSHVLGVEMSDS